MILPLKEKTALEAVDFALHDKRMFNRLYDINIWLEICCSLKKLRLLGLRSESTSEDLFAVCVFYNANLKFMRKLPLSLYLRTNPKSLAVEEYLWATQLSNQC